MFELDDLSNTQTNTLNNTQGTEKGVRKESEPLFEPKQKDKVKFSNLFHHNHFPWIVVIVVIVIAIGFSAYQVIKSRELNKQLNELKQTPQKAVEGETKALIEKIGKLIILPKDEQPTVATVTDLKPLQDQPFFKNAKINDKVLIYSVSKKAVLYRPDENIIIEVAPLNLDSGASTAGTESVPPQTPQTPQTNTPAPVK